MLLIQIKLMQCCSTTWLQVCLITKDDPGLLIPLLLLYSMPALCDAGGHTQDFIMLAEPSAN